MKYSGKDKAAFLLSIMPKKCTSMATIEIFKNESFGEVRVFGTSEDPLFCLADICRILDLQNPTTVKNRLDPEDVQLIDLHALNYTEGIAFGNTKTNFVTESGFYDVILQSSSPKVKPFRKWITSEVLPSIRKHGSYSVKKPKQDAPRLSDKLKVANWLITTLNLNETSKLILAKSIADPLGLPTPDYVPSKGVLKSATELLKANGCNISAQTFNQKAIEAGILCEMQRNSSCGKKKPFKSITEKGLLYGENQVNPNNPKSIQPLWYEDKFVELLNALNLSVEEIQ